jgi:hypothetical protein
MGEGCEAMGEALGQGDTAVGDAEEEQVFFARMTGGNGCGQPLNCGVNLPGTNGLWLGHEARF